MTLSPDDVVIFEWSTWELNATILYTWLIMAGLTGGSWWITRRLRKPGKDVGELSRGHLLLEVLVIGIQDQIAEISSKGGKTALPFVGTLFIFILTANLLSIMPGYMAPTGSLSTTTALAVCVFVAVPVFGIFEQGFGGYLKHYIKPTWLMLPFNIIGEFSRTMALAVRLYGNIMSGTVLVAILISLTPYLFPVVMQLLGLLTGVIQAYIFAVLAMVYIASATSAQSPPQDAPP